MPTLPEDRVGIYFCPFEGYGLAQFCARYWPLSARNWIVPDTGRFLARYGARNSPLTAPKWAGMILDIFLVYFWPIISPGQEWAKNGPVLGRILAQDCARYGLLSVQDWNGLRLGQNRDSFGPILAYIWCHIWFLLWRGTGAV